MADIIDYLDWRGDICFDISPFNEVDILILAQICYTDFEGVITQDDTLSIVDTARLYFEIHTEEEIPGRDTLYKMAPLVLKRAAESKRFQEIYLKNYINIISMDREEQFSAITFSFPDGMQYVAFRGTDNTPVGRKEDFNLCFLSETAGQKRAVEYINNYFRADAGKTSGENNSSDNQKCADIILGGHSEGGNFAIYSAAFCEPRIRERIVSVYSDDDPGFREKILETEEYKAVLPKIRSFIQIGGDYSFTEIKDEERIPREKKRIRKQMVERRRKLPKLQVKERSENICKKIISSEAYENSEKILVYMSIQNEVNMNCLIKTAGSDGKIVYIPRVVSETEMKFYRYDGRFVRGNFDIREPAGNIEYDFQGNTLLILPGVAYDKENNRLGYGGGYYDRFIEAFRKSDFEGKYRLDIFAVGYDFQVVEALPAGKHDQKPDEVITG